MSGEPFARPFVEPHIRFRVHVPEAEERITPSVEDTLQADVSLSTRERGIETSGGIITNYLDGDESVFDIEDSLASVREINIIQEEIINSVNQYTGTTVAGSDITVEAALIRVFTSRRLR